MVNNRADASRESVIDRSSFTEAQWEALSLYAEARKRQRYFHRTALPALATVAVAWVIVQALLEGTKGSSFMPTWLQTAVAILALAMGLSGFLMFRWAVGQGRARLRASGVSGEWIEALDKHPSHKF